MHVYDQIRNSLHSKRFQRTKRYSRVARNRKIAFLLPEMLATQAKIRNKLKTKFNGVTGIVYCYYYYYKKKPVIILGYKMVVYYYNGTEHSQF